MVYRVPRGSTAENLPWILDGNGENLNELAGRGLLRVLASLSGRTLRKPRKTVLNMCKITDLTLDKLIEAGWVQPVGNDVILTEKGLEMGPIAQAIKEGIKHVVKNRRANQQRD